MSTELEALSLRVGRLEARTAWLVRWWMISLAAVAGGAAWLGATSRSGADAPSKELILVDGDQRLELHPSGMRITTPTAETNVTGTEVAITSTASKRKAALRVDDKNGIAQLSVQSGGDRTASLVVGPYTELELVGDASSVDLRAAEEARVAARSDAFTYAEVTAKGTQPCWTLGVKTGTAMRTCNDKK
jgi:hypothetical protein